MALIFPKYSETDFPIKVGIDNSFNILTTSFCVDIIEFELLDCNRIKFNN